MELGDNFGIDVVQITEGSVYFDEVIGHIEDIILSANFQELHERFLETYWQRFEDTEENKLEYMDIFNEYTATFECFLVSNLIERMAHFNMQRFADELDTNNVFSDSIEKGEIYELLHSFTNFQVFKDQMLDYRSQKEGHVQHLDLDILITKPMLCAEPALVRDDRADIRLFKTMD